MNVYHGTSSAYLIAILARGIVPRGHRPGQWKKFPSRPDHVYLSTAYAGYFAINATLGNGGKAMLLEVKLDWLDEDRLYPDEDFIQETQRSLGDKAANAQIKHRIGRYQPYWRTSLEQMGNISHRGTVPPNAITRYALLDPDARPAIAERLLHPEVSALNYTAMASFYRGTLAWLFGDQPAMPTDGWSQQILMFAEEGPACAELREVAQKRASFMAEESQDRTGIEVVML